MGKMEKNNKFIDGLFIVLEEALFSEQILYLKKD